MLILFKVIVPFCHFKFFQSLCGIGAGQGLTVILFPVRFHPWTHHATFAIKHVEMLLDVLNPFFKLTDSCFYSVFSIGGNYGARKQILV